MAYRVLVVDDSPVMRVMLGDMLKALGHEVVAEAGTCKACLEAYRRDKPDLVTLDICLPDENGLVVLRKLRKLAPRVKVLVVTGSDQQTLERALLFMGVLGILHKPFDETELDALLRHGPRPRPRQGPP